jgi:hypothetical protein
MNIYQKLNWARKKFHSLKLEKTGLNKFAGYKYFELGDFLIPALTCFDEAGLTAIVSFTGDTATMTIYTSIGDNGSYDKIVITSPMGSAQLKGCHEVQNIGAVETYQRRYLWVAALEIVEHDALDATTGAEDKRISAPKEAAKAAAKVIEEDRKSELEQMAIDAINFFKADQKAKCMELVHEVTDNEEKLFFWDLLAAESKMRAFIKAQKDLVKEQ